MRPGQPDASQASGVSYPPAPWRLCGNMYGALLRLPNGVVPQDELPQHIGVERGDGSLIAAVVWAEYGPGSVLAYREFMVVAMTRLTVPLTGTVLRIWVDSAESREGGRNLWRIPKGLAGFSFRQGDDFTGSIMIDGKEQASYSFAPRCTVPGRWPFRMIVQQDTEAGRRRTVSSMRGRLQIGGGELNIPQDGELAYLGRGSVITHIAVRNFQAQFGRRSLDIST